jgi:RND superfamily putative drug exporter
MTTSHEPGLRQRTGHRRGGLAVWTERWARACARRPGRVVAVWLAVLVAAVGAIGAFLGSGLTTQQQFLSPVESWTGYQLLTERLPEAKDAGETIVVRSDTLSVDDPAFRGFVTDLADRVQATPRVGAVVTGYDTQGAPPVSADRHATLLTFRMTDEADGPSDVGAVIDLVRTADGDPRFGVTVTGTATVGRDFLDLSNHDLATGELMFGLPAALVVVLLVFGAVGAGALPLILAAVVIPASLGVAALIGQAHPLSFFLVNMVTAMGLALGIDYSLFVVSRYREERRHGREKVDAIAAAGGTAAVAVAFSGTSFAVALLGLLLVPDLVLRSLAAGSVIVGVIAVAAALTLLPALLSLLGDRVNALPIPFLHNASVRSDHREARFWWALVGTVTRHPRTWLAGSVVLLLACATPVLALQTGNSGVESLPDRSVSKQGFAAIQRSFPAGSQANPARVVIDGDVSSPAARAAIEELRRGAEGSGRFGPVTVLLEPADRIAVVDVPLRGDPTSDTAAQGLAELRTKLIPAALGGATLRSYVTGQTAISVDYADLTDRWLPRVIAFTLALTLVLLTVAFRSVVLSVKAVLLNLLSVGAAYGLLVLVFQKGIGAELLGVQQVNVVEAWLPVFLFSVLFALSMDYHVFLLSRIRERYAESGDNVEAVVHGISTTARIITGAALIIVVVFAGFATGDLVMFQQMGFGVAVALLLDATVVRSIVVPAGMTLLGRWNWYLPRWLAWLPELQIETPATTPAPRSGRPGD